MPELPEVETVVRSLRPHLLNKTIGQIEIYTAKLRQIIPDTLQHQLNHQITSVERKAKYIVIATSAKEEIITHLGMTGNFTIKDKVEYLRAKHDHLVIHLNDGKLLIYHDPRKFGLVTTTTAAPDSFHNAAIDAIDDAFTSDYLDLALRKTPKAPIKLALMNNNIVSGIGNIYASEALFRARILPTRASATLDIKELDLVITTIKEVLFEAISAGGSSIKDYKNASGEKGWFQQQLLVYGRDKKLCPICSGTITRINISGRSTFFCTSCQK